MTDDAREAWREVLTTSDEAEAAIISGLIESAGIPCRVDSSRVSQLPVSFGRMGEFHVLVREADAGLAAALLEDASGEREG